METLCQNPLSFRFQISISTLFFLKHDVLIIPKSTKPRHIVENTKLFDFELSPEDLETLRNMNEGVHYCWNPDVIV